MNEPIYDLINAERQYQDRHHGTLDENPHSIGEWLIILEAELDEAKHSWVKLGEEAALFEVLQFAAVAIACLEQHVKAGLFLIRGTGGASVDGMHEGQIIQERSQQ